MTLILSQKWDRLHADPLQSKQRWYCHCGARYKTKYGVLVEIQVDEARFCYCLAEFPPDSLKDAKSMMIERQYRQCSTPQDLLAALPRISPSDKGAVMTPMPNRDGHYKIDPDAFATIPKLEWFQLFNLEKVEKV